MGRGHKMRGGWWLLTVILALAASSCRQKQQNAPMNNSIDDVERFAAMIADNISHNRIDSLTAYYPGIEKADSLKGPFPPDSVEVLETVNPDEFEILMHPDVKITAVRNGDGSFTITKSYGLFAFDQYKVELAKKGGMWEDFKTDVEIAEKLSDEGYFDYIRNKSVLKTSDIVSLDMPDYSEATDGRTGFQTLNNLTDTEISSEDYTINRLIVSDEKSKTVSEPGKPIPPKGSVRIEVWETPGETSRITGVIFQLPQEVLQEKFAPYSGREYQEYLESKGAL